MAAKGTVTMRGDGNGWVVDRDGSKRWGRFGAAGLLLRAPGPQGEAHALIQHRAQWSHQGGTWSLPGGARDSHETVVEAAVREAIEETGIDPQHITIRGIKETWRTEAGWTYTTVYADATHPLTLHANDESEELRWVNEPEVDQLPLHPAMEACWPDMRTRPITLKISDSDKEFHALRSAISSPRYGRTVELPQGRYGWLSRTGEPLEIDVDIPRGLVQQWIS